MPPVKRATDRGRIVCLVLAVGLSAIAALAAEEIPLWPEGVPGAREGTTPETVGEGERIENVHSPSLTYYPAPSAEGQNAAVIICPGGAYRLLSFAKEGRVPAEWLNSLGISAFILKYRLREYGHPAPLRDGLRAVRLVRSRAAEWRIDARRIGVMGFSAGGHLAASVATMFDSPEGRTGSPLDDVSARPDFAILVYPVITLKDPSAHRGSRENLLGSAPPDDLIEEMSAENRVTAQTPPTFLVHGGTDSSVPAENSLLFYAALRRLGISAELHIFEKGPHGFGLNPGFGPISEWPRLCAAWLATRGIVQSPHQYQ
jgi:acetyl esterase/lipase